MPKKSKASDRIKERRNQKDALKRQAASDSEGEEEDEEEEEKINVCDVDDGKNYKTSMTDFITEVLASGRIKDKFVRIILRSTESKQKDITFLFDSRSLYLDGFIIDGVLFELRRSTDPVRLKGSTHLGYGVQYRQLSAMSKIQVGLKPLRHAFKKISNFRGLKSSGYSYWLKDIKPGLATVVVMFAEGGRFSWVCNKLESVVNKEAKEGGKKEDVPILVDDRMCDTFPFWSKISRVARHGGPGDDDRDTPAPPLPTRRPRDYTCQHVTNAKRYKIWAKDLIHVPNLDDHDDVEEEEEEDTR